MLIFISHDYEKSLGFWGLSPGFGAVLEVFRIFRLTGLVYTLWLYIHCGRIYVVVQFYPWFKFYHCLLVKLALAEQDSKNAGVSCFFSCRSQAMLPGVPS